MEWDLKDFNFMFKLEEIPVYFIENKNLSVHYGIKNRHVAFLSTNSKGKPIIIITELFFQFQEKYRNVILYHEVGHYVFRDRNLIGIKREYAADAYAISKTNYIDVIGALEYTIGLHKESPADIYTRIANIKRYFKL